MVATMKIISLAFDLDQGRIESLPSLVEFLGYVLHPGSIVFGPWLSYEEYANIDLHAKKPIVSSIHDSICVLSHWPLGDLNEILVTFQNWGVV